uniref:uncharacterized protein LOC131107810 isoform X3 n=1 Tax=Doryrhamphus excisus TaxID=161450 RepID=UPI0025AEA651|nr:uncharacterized protein LOC131107810 isoform X3 [Doryrhamphus excisus]
MSESIGRKVQPFTIGTKLSVPAVPKCQEFTQTYLQNFDNCTLQQNLNSLYFSRQQVCAHDPCLVSPTSQQVAPMKHNQEDMAAAEDHLNQNVAPSSAVSRSIKKITISGNKERSENSILVGPRQRSLLRSTSENHNNNNNNISSASDPCIPRIVGVDCENKPSSRFKVFVKTDCCEDYSALLGQTRPKPDGEKSVQQCSVTAHPSEAGLAGKHEVREDVNKRKDILKSTWRLEKDARRRHLHTLNDKPTDVMLQSDRLTQCTSLFDKEVLQAEIWMKSQFQELKDDSKIQRCPLQDWDEASQIVQRDLKDFDNTLIQLNQTGDQLICKLNPTSDLVKKQLSQLKDQWNILKQTATNQSRVLGGAKNLQEFNKKVDKLEAWIKKKEEEQYLVNVLGANVDKMQLTRRILFLKQDEQLYRTLHEEINNLALKLEKQGKTDSKSISSRRKNINKMWMKVQSHLKKHQDHLHLALEVSSFYQQADNTLFAINNMMKSITASKEPDLFGDREIRDIASQIMMLDVSVSQLSNLHPALAAGVTQKQIELKDCWASLQKVFRSERTTLSPTGSTFTREDADLLTPAQKLLSNMGTESGRIMGKEGTEWPSHPNGYTSTSEGHASARQSQPQQSVNHTPSPMADGPAFADDVIVSHQSRRESSKRRVEPRHATASPGHPQLHIQLQKFTVSADKTLSWLKDNVSMATQVCSIATFEGMEAARRCQYAVQQEIITNKARIEVVKREGHGLVRAQHPGSAKIEQFLSQLEVLWEELQRRHQKNAGFLQASEDLGIRVAKVLQALESLEAWLEEESSRANDPETMTIAERENCLLEKEVAIRSLELNALRKEVERLHGHGHPNTQGLPARMEEVERKYQTVLSALTQQSSKLQDTRMLNEFLERVELEESQEFDTSQYCLVQPLHSKSSSPSDLLGLQSSGGGDLMDGMGDPVKELREAVEMLNDTVRERGRSQNHDQDLQELLSRQTRLAGCIEECLCCCKDLTLDILEKETDMAVQCELDHCGLEALQERHDHLEVDYEVLSDKVKEMEKQASCLKEQERAHVPWVKIQETLQAWTELGKSVTEIKSRLQEFCHLQDFFRSYLTMISWTEDTRSCIFSDTSLHLMEDGPSVLATELDIQIQEKFEEFDELTATGRNILDKEHHLSQMVGERMEELQSMLGWISLHWRAKKQEWLHKKSTQEHSIDNVYSEATLYSPLSEAIYSYESCQAPNANSEESKLKTEANNQSSEAFPGYKQHPEDAYEVMKGIGQWEGELLQSESPTPSIMVVKEPGSPSLGGEVNLILSFGNTGDSQVQVLNCPVRHDEVVDVTSEPLHRPTVPACKNFWKRCQGFLENTLGSLTRKKKIYRQSANEVSTFLQVKDNNLTMAPVYESITLPRQKSLSTSSPTISPPSSSPSASMPVPQTSVSFHPLNGKTCNSFIFSSLKRMGKKRKRKRDTRRHTIQKVMGVDEETDEPHYTSETIPYDTHTWPLKEGRRKKCAPQLGDGVDAVADLQNPLLSKTDTDCPGEYTITPYAVSLGPATPSQGRGHCRFLSLGSVLSFDLPKDMTLIPSIPDIITIAPPESKKGAGIDPDANFHRHIALSSFKQARPSTANAGSVSSAEIHSERQTSTVLKKDFPDNGRTFNTTPPAPEEDEDQMVPGSDLSAKKFSQQENTEQDWETMSSASKTRHDDTCQSSQLPIYVNQPHPSMTAAHKHQCPSVHTLIRDLSGHKYHKSAHNENPGQCPHQASHVVVSLKSAVNVRQDSMDSGISSSSSIKLCPDAPYSDNPQITGVVGKLMSLQVRRIDCTKMTECMGPSKASEDLQEPVHLDHQQFEEEEEELEDIWNQTNNFRQSICSDIIYQPNQDESVSLDQPTESTPSLSPSKAPVMLYRNLATASEPNLFVAEFSLPSDIQSFLGHDKEPSPPGPSRTIKDRRSWAAFPNREQVGKTSVFWNETAADPVKLPDVVDNQKYIYQYREEEEEEPKGLEEMDENTDTSKNQAAQNIEVMDLQDRSTATGGRCCTTGKTPELQSMEGTLERKQKLQLGGKKERKAASRGWNSYHTVLYGHTLCFYQDRKDTLRSSACGLPLNLIGAECSPAPEYTKKPNCFRLRLRDGSEYLFNASSRFMMKKWMMGIQANTGPRQSASSSSSNPVDEDTAVALSPPLCSGCYGLAKCYCSTQHDVPSTFPRQKNPTTKEMVCHMPQSHLRHLKEHWNISSTHGHSCNNNDDDDNGSCKHESESRDNTSSMPLVKDRPSSKHRSHSFTSATYQKIKPTQQMSGGLERGSNYCVTLVLGDKPSESGTSGAPGWQQDACQMSCTSLPRPRNKSVFKKFFGKKDV